MGNYHHHHHHLRRLPCAHVTHKHTRIKTQTCKKTRHHTNAYKHGQEHAHMRRHRCLYLAYHKCARAHHTTTTAANPVSAATQSTAESSSCELRNSKHARLSTRILNDDRQPSGRFEETQL